MPWRRVLISSFLAMVLLAAYAVSQYRSWSNQSLHCSGSCVFSLSKDNPQQSFVDTLVVMKLARHPRLLVGVLYWVTSPSDWHAGTYVFASGVRISAVMHAIRRGPPPLSRLTIIEGWTISKMLAKIAALASIRHTIDTKKSNDLLSSLGYASGPAEGLFFPDTYFYAQMNSDKLVLKMAYRKMQRVLQRLWQQRSHALPYKTPYQALIVASLIERETHVADERPKIAEVIVNRLRRRMRLQIDASVVYGLSLPYGTRVTHRMLKQASPYNTYLHYGLPPTPICLPSLLSIQAAMQPSVGSALYYVLQRNGRHRFTSTYRGHLRAVRRYRRHRRRKELRKRPIHACTSTLLPAILLLPDSSLFKLLNGLSLLLSCQKQWAGA